MSRPIKEILNIECGLCQIINNESTLKDGIITMATHRFFSLFCKFNLVIWIKVLSEYFFPSDKITKKLFLDSYVIVKWLLILCFISYGTTSLLAEITAWYLLWSNLFMYIFFHVFFGNTWNCDKKSNRTDTRFIFSILALMYSFFIFAYLYQYPYASHIKWENAGGVNFFNALYLSITTSFTLTYEGISPLDSTARGLFLLQLLNTFLFITIIIGNSIPQKYTKLEKE